MFEQILGIVLDSDKIDLCLVNKGVNSQEIILSVSEPIPSDIKKQGTRQAGEHIRGLCDRYHIHPDVVISAIPCGSSMFRHIHLPFTDQNKISKVYQYEIEQTLPCTLGEVIMDYQITRADRESGTDILVAVVPKKILEEHLNILKTAGIDPHVTTLDSAGLLFLQHRYFATNDKGIYALFDIGQNKATLLISEQSKVLLTRQIDSSDIHYLFRQIHLMLVSFCSSYNLKIEKIILTGNQKHISQVEELIKEELKIETEYIDSYKGLPIKIKGDDLNILPFLAAPFGLCLAQKFKKGDIWNFRQSTYAFQKTFTIPTQIRYVMLILIILTVIIGGFNLKIRYDYYKYRINLFEKEAQKILDTTLPGKAIGPETLSELKEAIKQEVNIQKKYQDFFAKDINALVILKELSEQIPEKYNIIIQEVFFQDNKVRIKGKTETFEMLDKLKSSLSASKVFSKINTEESNIRGKGKQVTFSLVLNLE